MSAALSRINNNNNNNDSLRNATGFISFVCIRHGKHVYTISVRSEKTVQLISHLIAPTASTAIMFQINYLCVS